MSDKLPLSVLDFFFGPARIMKDGVEVERRLVLEFEGNVDVVDDPTSDPPRTKLVFRGGNPFVAPGLRLTLESGVPASTTDQIDKTTLYWTPAAGGSGFFSTYENGAWATHTTAEVSISNAGLTAGKVYDVFVNGTGVISFSTAWTNDTTPAVALGSQDGVPVKAADHSLLHIGVVKVDLSTGKFQDSGGATPGTGGKRYTWSRYNQVRREIQFLTTSVSWPVASAGQWQVRAGAASSKFEYVTGDAHAVLNAEVICSTDVNAFDFTMVGIGIDSQTVNKARRYGTTGGVQNRPQVSADYCDAPGAGAHEIFWLERSSTASTSTFYGISGTAPAPSSDNWTGAGLSGFLMM